MFGGNIHCNTLHLFFFFSILPLAEGPYGQRSTFHLQGLVLLICLSMILHALGLTTIRLLGVRCTTLQRIIKGHGHLLIAPHPMRYYKLWIRYIFIAQYTILLCIQTGDSLMPKKTNGYCYHQPYLRHFLLLDVFSSGKRNRYLRASVYAHSNTNTHDDMRASFIYVRYIYIYMYLMS